MDPEATKNELFDALEHGDVEEAVKAATNLKNWLGDEGMMPVFGRRDLVRLLQGIILIGKSHIRMREKMS